MLERKDLNKMKRLFKEVVGKPNTKYKEVGKVIDEVIYEFSNKDSVLYILSYNGYITTYAEELDYFID